MMDEPFFATVDCKHEAAGAWVDAVDRPSWSRHHVKQLRRKNISRFHVDEAVVAAQGDANPVPDVGMRAVATDEIARVDLLRLIGIEAPHNGPNTVFALIEFGH